MKVERADHRESAASPRVPFKRSLDAERKASAPAKPPPAKVAVAKGTAKAVAVLTQARQKMDRVATQLAETRAKWTQEKRDGIDERALDSIVDELKKSFEAEPAQVSPAAVPVAGSSAQFSPVASAKIDAPRRAEAVVQLIEKIGLLMRSNRPALALTLNNAFAARIEVEKTGPGQVALKIQGWKGPPPAEDLARIREGLRQKGLKLASLSVS